MDPTLNLRPTPTRGQETNASDTTNFRFTGKDEWHVTLREGSKGGVLLCPFSDCNSMGQVLTLPLLLQIGHFTTCLPAAVALVGTLRALAPSWAEFRDVQGQGIP